MRCPNLIFRNLILTTSLMLLLTFMPQAAQSDEKPLTETEKIEALLKQVEGLKDAVFVRNGSEHDAKTAAKFLRGKWEKQGKDIKTAADFIEKIASKSSTSGQPYVIRFKDGHEVQCSDFLKAELKKLEAPPAPKGQTSSVPAG